MKALGIYAKKEVVKEMMRKADKDNSGSIELDEFMSLMAEKIVNIFVFYVFLGRKKYRRRVEKSF